MPMAQQPTLASIFEATKGDLASSLSGLTLPNDAERVQSVITDYLNQVCDENNDYRQNLTQSEDYILQAALSMLNAQRALVATFECKPQITITSVASEATYTEKQKASFSDTQQKSTTTFIGVGSGALVGKLLLGGWGAVFGAIAGTAIALYLSQKAAQPAAHKTPNIPAVAPKVKITDTPIDITALLAVIAQICDSLDNLIATFRAQIQRVVHKYESQDKPTIERDFRVLLEGIQSLIGYKRGHSPEEEKYLAKLQTRVEDLAELLDNYDLETIDYTPEHSDWFEAVESKNATEIKMVTPAIVKGGGLVIKGKIFIPNKL